MTCILRVWVVSCVSDLHVRTGFQALLGTGCKTEGPRLPRHPMSMLAKDAKWISMDPPVMTSMQECSLLLQAFAVPWPPSSTSTMRKTRFNSCRPLLCTCRATCGVHSLALLASVGKLIAVDGLRCLVSLCTARQLNHTCVNEQFSQRQPATRRRHTLLVCRT